MGPQYRALSPAAGTLVAVALEADPACGNITCDFFSNGALVESHVFPPGPSVIAYSGAYPLNALREIRVTPTLLFTGFIRLTARWRS